MQDSIFPWKDIRKEFVVINPELGEIIDELDPGNDHRFYYLSYPYGSYILKQGRLYLPRDSETIPLVRAKSSVVEDLGYNFGANPVSIILENTSEVFMDLSDRVVPMSAPIPKGKIFGVWHVLSAHKVSPNSNYLANAPDLTWDMTAGVRSIFMLQKISEKQSHNSLVNNFNLSSNSAPKTMTEHWQVFKEISSSYNFNTQWKTKILFFNKTWFDHKDDPAWNKFYLYLHRKAWEGSSYWRNQFQWDLVFSIIQKNRQIKPSAYTMNIVRHLLDVASGAVTGFAPTDGNTAAPIDLIKDAYKNVYKIFGYPPTIMTPQSFSDNSFNLPVYYSLNFPASIEFPQKAKERSSLISELKEINALLEIIIEEMLTENLNIENTIMFDAIRNTEFSFVHSEGQNYKNIMPLQHIPKLDSRFYHDDNTAFPLNSPFFRGCIKITKKQPAVTENSSTANKNLTVPFSLS